MQIKEGSSAPTFTEVTQSVGQHEEKEENTSVWIWAEIDQRRRQISESEPSAQIRGLNTVCSLNADWLMSSGAVNPGVMELLTPPSSVFIYKHHLDGSSVRHEAEFIWLSAAGWTSLMFHSVFRDQKPFSCRAENNRCDRNRHTPFVFYPTHQWNLEGNDAVHSVCCVQTCWQTAAGGFSVICFLLLSQTVWRVESNRWTLFCSDELIHSFQTKN